MRICGFSLSLVNQPFVMSGGAPGGTPRLVTGHVLVPPALVLTPCRYLEDKQLRQGGKTLTEAVFKRFVEKEKFCRVLKISKIWSLLILFHTFSHHALSCRPKKNVFIMESRHRKTLFHLFSGPSFTLCRGFFQWKCDTSRKHS